MADVKALVDALTLEEKATLTAGEDLFSTAAVERLGIPKVQVTDGPSGARGSGLPGAGGPPSTCIPCGSAIGASWNPELARSLGALVGREALDRGCRGLLAPTVNLHRSPLAGRNFECYSEDPLLSGRLAAGYVRGVQSEGVFATVKHFVGNEAEFERGSISSVIDERALRELYLLPFEIAIREGGALAIMTAYNRLNGRWLTQQPAFLLDLLRGEWGFEGLVMTDWFAVAETTLSLGAGLDLEMPGPGRALGPAVLAPLLMGPSARWTSTPRCTDCSTGSTALACSMSRSRRRTSSPQRTQTWRCSVGLRLNQWSCSKMMARCHCTSARWLGSPSSVPMPSHPASWAVGPPR